MRFGQVGQARAFGQGDGERLPGQAGEHADAGFDFVGRVAAAAQGFDDALVFAGRCRVAGTPAAPGTEVGVLEHIVQDHAEAGAGEARIEAVAGVRQRSRLVRFGRFVAAAGGRLGRGAGGIVAGVGVGQLGETVDPPVAGQRTGRLARWRNLALVLRRQPRQRRRRLRRVEDDAAGSARGQRGRIAHHRPQRRLGVVVERAGRQPQRIAGTGEPDIQQACILGTLRALPGLGGAAPAAAAGLQLPVQHAAVVLVHHHAAAGVRRLAADADEGQEHQRVFQALALVQGHHLHPPRVRFQAQLLRFVVGAGVGDGLLQPVDQAVQAQRASLRFLQLFGQLQVVGQAALAVEQAEQAGGVLRAQVADQRQRAALLQALAPAQRGGLPLAQCGAIGIQPSQPVRVLADQHRGQGRAQARVVAAVQQRLQQGMQFMRLGGGEQALPAGGHRRDADRRQRLADAGGLAVLAHQYGDVARLHGAAVDRGAAGAGIGQHGMDRGDAGRGGQLPRAAGAVRLRLAAGGFVRGRRLPQHQRRCGCAVAQVVGVGTMAARPHGMERDARVDERRVQLVVVAGGGRGLRVQRPDRAEHGRARAEVVRQRRRLLRGGACGQVGFHVAAAEAVDRLLGVADHEQGRIIAAGAEHAVEDLPLARIGVLELVDQGDGVLLAQLPGQCSGVRSFQRIGDAVDQVVEGLHPQLLLLRGQAAARIRADAMQQCGAARLLVVAHRRQRAGVVLHRGAQRRIGRAPGGGLGGARLQGLAVQLRQLGVRERLPRIAGGAPAAQGGEQVLDPFGLVAAAVQHLAVDRRQQRLAEAVGMDACRFQQRARGCLQHRRGIGQGGGRGRPQDRFAHQQRQVLRQRLVTRRPQRREVLDAVVVTAMRAPQVGGDRLAQHEVAGQQFRRMEALAAFQRMLAQHPRAEAVDGEHRCLVDAVGRGPQAAPHRVAGLAAGGQVRVDQGGGGCGFGIRGIAWRAGGDVGGQQQSPAHAGAQLLGGRFGEGHGEDALHRQRAFQHQPHHQGGQGEGLAGTGGGLDRAHAGQRQREVGVRAAHAVSSASQASARPLSAAGSTPA